MTVVGEPVRDGTRLLRATAGFVDNPDFRVARQSCTVVPAMAAVLKGFNPQPDPPGHLQQAR